MPLTNIHTHCQAGFGELTECLIRRRSWRLAVLSLVGICGSSVRIWTGVVMVVIGLIPGWTRGGVVSKSTMVM